MNRIKEITKSLLPGFIRRPLIHLSYTFKSKTREIRRSMSKIITADNLINNLKNAGIGPGDTIMVHSSLSSIGNVESGAQTIIECFMNLVTSGGTIVMPAYGTVEIVQQDYATGRLTDLRFQKSNAGLITELFRAWPNVYRSSHPFSSVCAWGKHAKYITSGHANNMKICHNDSPAARLLELKGSIIGIGVTLFPAIIYHVLEDAWDGFPFNVHSSPFVVEYIDATGNNIKREIVQYDPNVSKTRIDQKCNDWIRDCFAQHFTSVGVLTWFQFGNTKSWIMDTEKAFKELKRLAGKGITIYLTKEKWLSLNNGDENIEKW